MKTPESQRDGFVTVTFDLGTVGRVAWSMPRKGINPTLSDTQINALMQTAWRDTVKSLFGLVYAVMISGSNSTTEFAMTVMDGHLREVARTVLRRLKAGH
jgi:hypothetical protein